jgi:hypothetical protein
VANTNFDLAPPARDVDGLHAVPIDILRITARLTFDAATQTSTGDATLDFVMGRENGCPIFDLRQTITGVWLDGAAVPTTQAASHDFGGGAGAELRVLAQTVTAGTQHTLRVAYTLGPPQASTAGSYLPALTWSTGPRLRFNFGFTDLGPGRYLESWIPANLIFDQYEIILELQVSNTAIAHSLITNGTVTSLGPNHWSAFFPARMTAFSPLVELRASDTLASHTGVAVLPGGAPVTIEAWKLTSSAIDLAAEVTALSGFLFDNASGIGPYMHGSRFIVFFAGGGMEYDGATTTGAGSLKHETHHSWWGRGVKPASQNDGWIDEAWTVYVTGNLTPLAFSTSDPPVQLYSQNPWVRATPSAAYSSGARLFQGLTSLAGDAILRNAMASFYQSHQSRPITTLQLEGHLLSQTGKPEMVDSFHRWVYGYPDSAAPSDLWMRDDPGHTGAEAWAGRFWDSPDLWIRNADDGGTAHQNAIAGRDNWFYARVRNRGAAAARHFMVTFAVKQFAGTQFVYPGDFLPAIAATGSFDLAPGGTAVVKALWPAAQVPAAGVHGCLLASVHAKGNHPAGGRHVWEENALAQKNLTIVSALRGAKIVVPVMVGHWTLAARAVVLELRRPKGFPDLRATIAYPKIPGPAPIGDGGIELDCAARIETTAAREPDVVINDAGDATDALLPITQETLVPAGLTARVTIKSAAAFPLRLGLVLVSPENAQPGETLLLDLVQLDANGRPAGGIAVALGIKG